MDEDIFTQCEQSFYKELYHDAADKRSIVMDQVSGRIWVRKKLAIYSLPVFQYLREHHNIHIPTIHAFWQEEDKLVVIEELLSGCTLEYLLENNALQEAQKRDILLQICDGLAFLHNAKPSIIHRDLKPSNIMVTDEGIVKIIDYDAAKIFEPEQTGDTIHIGTQGSAAPEQYGFGKCDTRTDIYGLGVMVRDMFPEDGQMQKIAEKATRLEPAQRYQTVGQIRRKIAGRQYSDPAASSGSGSAFAGGRKFPGIPGFRTRTPWKMALASFCYFILIWLLVTFEVTRDGKPVTGIGLWLNRICFAGMCLSLVDLFTNWTGFFRRFPLMHSKSHRVLSRILGYCLSAAAIMLFWVTVCALGMQIIA